MENQRPIFWQYRLKIAFIIGVVFFSYLMLNIILPYTAFRLDTDFLKTKMNIIHFKHWRYAFYIHVFTSIFALTAGITQFSKRLMFDYPIWHRNMGKLYVFSVLFFSAPSGLLMSFYANGGTFAIISFVLLSSLWLITTYLAYYYALQKKWTLHADFMLRSYALAFSAITLRSYTYMLHPITDWSPFVLYNVVAWLSWIPNLLFAQYLIQQGWTKSFFKKNESPKT